MSMCVKRKVDKTHQDYPEYIEKCRSMSEKYIALEQKAEDEYPEWRGKDHPASEKIHAIKRQFHAELKLLQQEYSHIFKEE